MTIRNEQRLYEEIVVFLRNSDILSIAERGVTTTTDTSTSSAGQTSITLAHNVVRNIRSFSVAGNQQAMYTTVTPSYGVSATTITFPAVPGNLALSVTYDYSAGTAEKIFPDYPEIIYLVDSAPRIGFGIEMSKTNPIGIGSPNWLTDDVCNIKVYSKNLKSLDGYIYTLRNAIKNNQKGFFTFPFAYASTISPVMTIEHMNKKVFMKSIDLYLRFNFES